MDDDTVEMNLDLVINDEIAFSRIIRRMQSILVRMSAERMSKEARALWREAYGIIGDDTILGVPNGGSSGPVGDTQ